VLQQGCAALRRGIAAVQCRRHCGPSQSREHFMMVKFYLILFTDMCHAGERCRRATHMANIKECLDLQSGSIATVSLGMLAAFCLTSADVLDMLFVRFGLDIVQEVALWADCHIDALVFL
jgi:hypothetical protein